MHYDQKWSAENDGALKKMQKPIFEGVICIFKYVKIGTL